MPWWMTLYFTLFCLLLTLNLISIVRQKARAWFIGYEFLSGLLMVLLVPTYWVPSARALMCWPLAIAFFAVIGFDFYFSIWGSLKLAGITPPDGLDETEMEWAKALSILFAAPAYVVGALATLRFMTGA